MLPEDERAQSVNCRKANGINSPIAKAKAKVLMSISLKACAVFKSGRASNVLVKGRALARPSERSERFEPIVIRL